jgi:hypothetical protein
MKRIVLFITLFALLPVFAHAVTFAQLALGGGYEAVLIITNTTNSSRSGKIWVRQGFNQRWEGRWAVQGQNSSGTDYVTYTLRPRGSVKLRLTGDTVTRVGYLEIETDSGVDDVAVSYFYEFRIGGSLRDTVGSPESPLGKRFVFGVEKTATVDTGFAWCPSSRFGASVFPVELTLYGDDGSIRLQKAITFTGHLAAFISEIFTELGQGSFRGSLEVESPVQLHLEVLRLEETATGFQLTSTPAAADVQ